MTARPSCLSGGGEAGARLRAVDWASNPLGPVAGWPLSLQAAVRIVLNSEFPMMLHWGPELISVYNDAYAPSLGRKHPGHLGRPAREWWPEMWDQLQPIFDTVLAGKPYFVEDARYTPDRDGVSRDAFFTHCHSPLWDDEGTIAGIFLVVTETTRQVVAERELKRANAALSQQVRQQTLALDRLWDTSPDLLVVADADGLLRRVNLAWTVLLGYEPGDLLGRPVTEAVVPEDRETTAEAFALAARGGLPRLLTRCRHRDGTPRWISWVAAPDGGMVYATGRDVTAETEREARLRDAQDFARLALSAVGGVGVWTYDVESDRFFYDDAIAKLYAIDPACGMAGLPRADFLANVHPEDRDALRSTMSGGLVSPGDLELEYRLCHPDGSVHWVLSRGHTYHDAEGRPVRRTGVGVDTTGQRQTEEALRQSQKMEAVGQLTGGVAHDFNNLLTIIRSSVDLLRRPDLPQERRGRYLDAVAETVDRAAKLTGQLLAFARRQALKPEVFDVGAKTRAIADMLDTVTGARVQVLVEVPDTPCHVRADLSQFETALVNMAVNARDAMKGEGTLTLRIAGGAAMPPIRGHAGSQRAFAAVSLTDTGCGIAPEQLARVFEPFFTTKEVGKGTGLGLSQVFGFAKQSGGDVDVSSLPDRGATFTLYLPEVAAEPAPEAGRADVPSPAARGQHVLVVEDNVGVGRFCTQILEDLGYRTTWAATAEDALARLGETGEGFDVVFSDVVMPGIGGLALAETLRRRLPEMPVVLASGYSHILAQDDAHGFALLHKPYSAEQLSRMLRRVMAETARRA